MITHSPIQPLLLSPGDGETYSGLEVTITPKTLGAQSGGQWLVVEYTAPPGSVGPRLHWHKTTTEIFYVLEGTLTLQVNEATQALRPGGYAYIPPHTVHAFSNLSHAPAKFLLVASPAGFEHYFIELVELAKTEPQWPPVDMSRILALMAKYDTFQS